MQWQPRGRGRRVWSPLEPRLGEWLGTASLSRQGSTSFSNLTLSLQRVYKETQGSSQESISEQGPVPDPENVLRDPRPPQLPDPTHLALLRSRLRPPAAPVPVARSRRPGERTTALDLRVAAPARSPRVRGEVCSTPDGRSVGSKAICGLRADLAPPSRTAGTGIPARRAGAGY